MGFSERTQAFIVAKYYEYLTAEFGRRGEAAFIHATKYYARQRGNRMAQRVIRDGEELNYASFCRYGEWKPSEDALKAGDACVMDIKSESPDFEYHVHICPWNRQFIEMGALRAGRLYCMYLDEAIMQGFSDVIQFKTIQTQYTGEKCIFRVENARMNTEIQKKEGITKDFDYHCAHTYYSYAEIIEAIFAEKGRKMAFMVMKDFRAAYGDEMAEKIQIYRDENFNIC